MCKVFKMKIYKCQVFIKNKINSVKIKKDTISQSTAHRKQKYKIGCNLRKTDTSMISKQDIFSWLSVAHSDWQTANKWN